MALAHSDLLRLLECLLIDFPVSVLCLSPVPRTVRDYVLVNKTRQLNHRARQAIFRFRLAIVREKGGGRIRFKIFLTGRIVGNLCSKHGG